MNKAQSSYRQILKATSLFGGVQVFNILITIVRSKVIAVLLGPSGIGVLGLLTSTTGLIAGLTNFGLGTSAVKNIAESDKGSDLTEVSRISQIFKKLVWITGLLGAALTFFLADWLSEVTFGNNEYSTAFIWLSVTLLLNQLSSGENVLLQGMRRLKDLARANLIGSFAGLVMSVPLYYFLGMKGIVPAMILSALLTYFVTRYFSRKIKLVKIKYTTNEFTEHSRDMLKMGIMLSLGSLIALGTSYITRIYISNTGSIEDVGLYSAGFAMISTYVGLVFAAMATDYYPRLSGVAQDKEQRNGLINQQAEIGLLIVAPILTVFLIFINWIIVLLYSQKFIPINEMVHWAALGTYFKVIGWSLGFLLLAKGVAMVFLWTQIISSIISLLLNIFGYHLMGLEGLGISYLLGFISYLILIYYVLYFRYEFTFHIDFYKIFSLQLMLGIICFLIIKFIPSPWSYLFGIPIILLSVWFSYAELDKRIDLKMLLLKYKK